MYMHEGDMARNALASVDVLHQVAPDDFAGGPPDGLEAPLASREGGEGEAASAGGARRAEAPHDIAAVVAEGGGEGVEGPFVIPLARGAQPHERRHHVGMGQVRAEHERVPPNDDAEDGVAAREGDERVDLDWEAGDVIAFHVVKMRVFAPRSLIGFAERVEDGRQHAVQAISHAMQPRGVQVRQCPHFPLPLAAEVVARHRRLHIPEPRERRLGFHGGDPSESPSTRAW